MHFTPSSRDLMDMIKAADAAFEAAREQAALRKEAQAEERACRLWTAQANAASRVRRWGV